jgi:phospholipase C
MVERREFLKLSALAAGFSAASISHALALPGDHKTGTLEDVQHIVVLMQENRAFDHYFGTLRGVRGFNDRVPIRLPGGKPVWFQPRQRAPGETLTPFHLDTSRTAV